MNDHVEIGFSLIGWEGSASFGPITEQSYVQQKQCLKTFDAQLNIAALKIKSGSFDEFFSKTLYRNSASPQP